MCFGMTIPAQQSALVEFWFERFKSQIASCAYLDILSLWISMMKFKCTQTFAISTLVAFATKIVDTSSLHRGAIYLTLPIYTIFTNSISFLKCCGWQELLAFAFALFQPVLASSKLCSIVAASVWHTPDTVPSDFEVSPDTIDSHSPWYWTLTGETFSLSHDSNCTINESFLESLNMLIVCCRGGWAAMAIGVCPRPKELVQKAFRGLGLYTGVSK